MPVYLCVITFVYALLFRNYAAQACGFAATFMVPFFLSETQIPFLNRTEQLTEQSLAMMSVATQRDRGAVAEP